MTTATPSVCLAEVTDRFSGDSDYVPPEEAAAQQLEQQRRTSLSNLTSPLKNEPSGEYDQKLVGFQIKLTRAFPAYYWAADMIVGSRSREEI